MTLKYQAIDSLKKLKANYQKQIESIDKLIVALENRDRKKAKEVNLPIYNEKRKAYMDNQIDFDEFYLWLADFIGATKDLLPVSIERIKSSTNEHFNDISLPLWDSKDEKVRPLAYDKGLPWSLSDTVCVLKAIAKAERGTENQSNREGEFA